MLSSLKDRNVIQLTTALVAEFPELHEVLQLAAYAHDGQERKAIRARAMHRDLYIIHPLRVALRIARWGVYDGRDQLIHAMTVALLHDVPEDCPARMLEHLELPATYSPADAMTLAFGASVSRDIVALTDPDSADGAGSAQPGPRHVRLRSACSAAPHRTQQWGLLAAVMGGRGAAQQLTRPAYRQMLGVLIDGGSDHRGDRFGVSALTGEQLRERVCLSHQLQRRLGLASSASAASARARSFSSSRSRPVRAVHRSPADPAARCLRHSTTCEEYRFSRRKITPRPARSAASYSARICAVYSAVNRYRLAFSDLGVTPSSSPTTVSARAIEPLPLLPPHAGGTGPARSAYVFTGCYEPM